MTIKLNPGIVNVYSMEIIFNNQNKCLISSWKRVKF